MSGIYHGTKFGFVQTTVTDQIGVALEGRLANASDINLCDGVSAGENIPVGYGVVYSALAGALKAGINSEQVKLPTASAQAADFGGIVVRTETGHTDVNGVNYTAEKEIATVLRSDRVGGRIWVKAQSAITKGGDLYWVVADDADSGLTAGGFAGSLVASKTVKLSGVKVISGAAKGDLCLVEICVPSPATIES